VFWNDEYTDTEQFVDLTFCLEFEGYVQLIAVGALFAGMALYSYMYNSKSANMIHSFPVDRTQLFGTTVISGWAFLIVPLFGAALLSTILCLVYTIPGIGYIWLWFLVVAALAIIAFSIVSICALFTGHIVVLPMYVIAVNFLSWLVYFLMQVVITTFGFGVTELGSKAEEIAGMFCPVECFYENLTWIYEYTDSGELREVSLEGIPFIWIYLVLAGIFYVSAYVIYRKRKIEQAGDFLTVNWVKPIFRSVIGIFGGIFGAMLVREVLIDTEIGCGMFGFIIAMLLIGAICYFAADMFIKKSFHVFKKKEWVGCGIFSAVLFVVFLGMCAIAVSYENYVPKQEDVEYAEINMGYEITLYGDKAAAIIDIQKDILEQADYAEKKLESGDRYYYNGVYISYRLNDGNTITRRYNLPCEDEVIKPIYEKIILLEEDKENFLVNSFGKDYADISVFYGGSLEAAFVNPEDRNKEEIDPDINYEDKSFDEAQAKEMYQAILADIEADTLMKYNVYTSKMMWDEKYGENYFKSSDASIYISYKLPEEESQGTMNQHKDSYIIYGEDVVEQVYPVDDEYVEYQKQRSTYLSFGPDCEHIINKLIEFGMITSVEDIWWGEAEELLK
jgi:ABC-2 type transport system permease protein